MIAHILLLGAAALPTGAPYVADTTQILRVAAHRISASEGAPVLDGRLDEAVWAAADSITGFVEVTPAPGEPSDFHTVARVLFDHQAVYVGVRAYDPEPELIAAQLTRRDNVFDSASDALAVNFDSHHDRRTAYGFGVNPAGVKSDFTITDDSNIDDTWNAVWEVEISKDERGWTAEFRIPLSALRFDADGDGVWGFQVVRKVHRDGEFSAWSPQRDDEPRLVSRFGELHGMTELPVPRRLEVLPYTVSGVDLAPGDAADPFYSATDWKVDAGADVKYGVTSDLTLDLTINPDFGQVEADPSQVNLTAFETFFRERRPFFTEGADIFRFGLAGGNDESLFYSRRIGRPPQGFADPLGGFVEAPEQTTILGAAKLSGRVGQGWSVGLLNAVTAQESARVRDSAGVFHADLVEPLSNYTVARLRRDLNRGRTQVGAVATGVVRALDDTGLDFLHSSAFTGGADVSHRFASDRWQLSAVVLGSEVRGSEQAIVRTQRAPQRYFQRPDADHVEVDEDATSLAGYAASAGVSKISGKWRGGGGVIARSPGFEVNDLGFQRFADVVGGGVDASYRQLEPNRLFRGSDLGANFSGGANYAGEVVELGGGIRGSAQFHNFWRVYGGVRREFETLDVTALRGGPAIISPVRYGGWFGVDSDDRKPFTVGLNGGWGVEPESEGGDFRLSLDAGWRPSASIQLSLEPFYSLSRNPWQYVSAPSDSLGERHYLFGDLDQRSVGMSARLNQTFTPDLTLQLYAQPFIATGAYRDYFEVADPVAGSFDDRFEPISGGLDTPERDFTVRDFKLNVVLRWEYRLGSTLFLVWSHDRAHTDGDGRFRPVDDLAVLFDAPSRNVLLVKVNYWLDI
ncbi:MAG: DUF5916 domain-containing protein [Longimicrobiaceae bacterium]